MFTLPTYLLKYTNIHTHTGHLVSTRRYKGNHLSDKLAILLRGFIKWEVGPLYPTPIPAEAILWFHPLLVVAPQAGILLVSESG